MRLIILAAGEGKRLRPHTNEVPKCMVRLGNIPLIERQLASIASCDFDKDDIALVGGYKQDKLNRLGIRQFKNPRYALTNMVTTLFCARDFMKSDEDLIISYGDIVYEESVLQSLIRSEGEICVAADVEWERLWRIRMSEPLSDAETFQMNEDGSIKELGKKPSSLAQIQAQYIGLLKIRGDMVSKFIHAYDAMDRHALYDGQDFENMYMTSFIQALINSGWHVKASLMKNAWLEVDTVSDLECYERKLEDGSLTDFYRF